MFLNYCRIYYYLQIPIQALRAVNDLVQAIALFRARLNPTTRENADG